jgi:hypothetical protein
VRATLHATPLAKFAWLATAVISCCLFLPQQFSLYCTSLCWLHQYDFNLLREILLGRRLLSLMRVSLANRLKRLLGASNPSKNYSHRIGTLAILQGMTISGWVFFFLYPSRFEEIRCLAITGFTRRMNWSFLRSIFLSLFIFHDFSVNNNNNNNNQFILTFFKNLFFKIFCKSFFWARNWQILYIISLFVYLFCFLLFDSYVPILLVSVLNRFKEWFEFYFLRLANFLFNHF